MAAYWKHGLCDCCSDCGVCCNYCCCYPCQECKLIAVSNGKPNCGCPECFCVLLCMPAIFCVRAFTRNKVRNYMGFPGNCCKDLCTACFCFPCTQCQEVRELEAQSIPAKFCNSCCCS
mmetsp:Transcript_22708/g.31985  ORF Transcript_22708/g.31985 Transcript_22708/m.31985 type:complete len:118 (-) Transcript_22708:64-417(-)